jgi:asparaginyl-tRNA synthetase
MSRIRVVEILRSETSPGQITVKGWVRTKRDSKAFSFLNDITRSTVWMYFP